MNIKCVWIINSMLIYILLNTGNTYGHADILEIKVSEFYSERKDEYVIVFEAEDNLQNDKYLPMKLKKYIVHIRYNPKRAAQDAHKYSYEDFQKAILFIRKQLKNSGSLEIWRYSGAGYNPIKNRKGHYRT